MSVNIDAEVTRLFVENQDSFRPVVINVGGARSSKSYSINQLLISKFCSERSINILSVRKTKPSLRLTSYKTVTDLMKEYKIYKHFIHNKTMLTFKNNKQDNYWVFTGMDSTEKIKSTEFNYIHIEEANEFTYDDYRILKLRLSKSNPTGNNRIYISFNPVECWIQDKLYGQPDVQIIRSNYKDNPFLPQSYVDQLEALKDEDPEYYKIYTLGEEGKLNKGALIFKPINIIDKRDYPQNVETIYGMDYGWAKPTVLVRVDIKEDNIFLTELIYETRLTTDDILARFRALDINQTDEIYPDPAEPAKSEEIRRKGYNVKQADRDVTPGIDLLNRLNVYSCLENDNLNREWRNYKNKVDIKGNILDEPVKFNDHCPDAVRYAVYTHLKGRYIKKRKGKVYSPADIARSRKEENEDEDENKHKFVPPWMWGKVKKGDKNARKKEKNGNKKRRKGRIWTP